MITLKLDLFKKHCRNKENFNIIDFMDIANLNNASIVLCSTCPFGTEKHAHIKIENEEYLAIVFEKLSVGITLTFKSVFQVTRYLDYMMNTNGVNLDSTNFSRLVSEARVLLPELCFPDDIPPFSEN